MYSLILFLSDFIAKVLKVYKMVFNNSSILGTYEELVAERDGLDRQLEEEEERVQLSLSSKPQIV